MRMALVCAVVAGVALIAWAPTDTTARFAATYSYDRTGGFAQRTFAPSRLADLSRLQDARVDGDLASRQLATQASVAAEEAGGARTLFHYTTEESQSGILESQRLNPSLKSVNPSDVRYGNGQYLSDIKPGTYSNASLSSRFLRNPYQGARFSHYVEVDVTGLDVVQGRPGVFVIPNEGPLDLLGRIVSWGKNG